jgi:hypothetical protein
MDAYGIRGFGNNLNTFTLDSITGDVTVTDGVITGGTIQTATSGKRVVISGDSNNMEFYKSGETSFVVKIDDSVYSTFPGIVLQTLTAYPNLETTIIPGYIEVNMDEDSITSSAISANNDRYSNSDTHGIRATAGKNDATSTADDRIAVGGYATALSSSNTDRHIGVYASANHFNNGNKYDIGLIAESDELPMRLQRFNDKTDRCDFILSTTGVLTIQPSGDRIRIQESAGGATAYADLWADTDGYLNITPAGEVTRLHNAAEDDYVQFEAATSGIVIKPSTHPDDARVGMQGLIGSSMLYVSYLNDTVETDEALIGGMRVQNTSNDAGTQCGIHFNTESAFAGIYGYRVTGNNQGLAFYTESGSRDTHMWLTPGGDLIHKDVLYPEIATGGSATTRTWTITVSDMSGSATSRIGDTAGIGSESTRGVVEWWVSWSEFGAPESIDGDGAITFTVTTGTNHGSVSETSRNFTTTNSSGVVVVQAQTTNNTSATNVWLHVRIGAGIVYSEEATVYTVLI